MKKVLVFVLACVVAAATMPVVACNSQKVLNAVESLAPVVTDVLVAACQFAPAPAPALCSTGAGLLSTDETHVFNLWQAFLTAQKNGTVTPSAWAELSLALQVLVNQSADVFALARVVNGAHQQEILAMVTAAEALLAVIESLLPAPPVAAMAAMRVQRLSAKLPAPNPKTGKYDREFFKSWQKSCNNLPGVKARGMQIRGANWLNGFCIPIGGADCSS